MVKDLRTYNVQLHKNCFKSTDNDLNTIVATIHEVEIGKITKENDTNYLNLWNAKRIRINMKKLT